MPELPKEPGLRRLPVAHHGLGRHVQHIGRLFDAEPAEVPQFHDLTHPRVERRQSAQGIAQGDHIALFRLRQVSLRRRHASAGGDCGRTRRGPVTSFAPPVPESASGCAIQCGWQYYPGIGSCELRRDGRSRQGLRISPARPRRTRPRVGPSRRCPAVGQPAGGSALQ